MPVEAWFMCTIAGLIVAIVASALLQVILHLRAVSKILTTLQGGVDAIATSTAPVEPSVDAVNGYLAPVRAWANGVSR
ncbi:MAG: hypothetical protein ACT4QF_09845 [Sporichthyaceae bacterium]